MSLALVRHDLGAADFSEFETRVSATAFAATTTSSRFRATMGETRCSRTSWMRSSTWPGVSPHVGAISPTLCADPAYIKIQLDQIALLKIPETDKVKHESNLK